MDWRTTCVLGGVFVATTGIAATVVVCGGGADKQLILAFLTLVGTPMGVLAGGLVQSAARKRKQREKSAESSAG